MLARAMDANVTRTRAACDKLSAAMLDALGAVRERTARDELPLFSLLQATPLQLQASHLSLQEYFAARDLCDQGSLPANAFPWEWTAWWANALTLGTEMGGPFVRGLLRAAGVTGDALDLSQRLGGDAPTVMRVMVLFGTVLDTLELRGNAVDAEGAQTIARALASGASALSRLSLEKTSIGSEGAHAIAVAVQASESRLRKLNLDGYELDLPPLKGIEPVEALNLSQRHLGVASAIIIAHCLERNPRLIALNLSSNTVGDEGASVLGQSLRANHTLRELQLEFCGVGTGGGKGLLAALAQRAAPLSTLNLSRNLLGPEAISDGLREGRASFGLLDLSHNYLSGVGARAIAQAMTTGVLETISLNLAKNSLRDYGAKAVINSLTGSQAAPVELDLSLNHVGPEGGLVVARALTEGVGSIRLHKLNLMGNSIGARSEQAIRASALGYDQLELLLSEPPLRGSGLNYSPTRV